MSTRRPNIIFILTDDQGYGEIGAHGNTDIQTPCLDTLHSESTRFTDFHVGTTCAPTRSGLLTGHYCNSTGVWHTIGGRSLLREDEWTLANALSEAGYRTGHFGKWHLGDAQPFRPHDRGFETAIYHGGGGIGNTPDAWGNDYFDDVYSVNGVPQQFKGYCTDVFFREALSFIESHREEPFFCYIATNAPHGPMNVEPRYRDPYMALAPDEDRARFYGMVTNIDENIGILRERLEALGLAENTIVVFMTDNGSGGGVSSDENEHVEEGPCNFNAGMRGYKGSQYEGGHRVPFFLYDPRSTNRQGDVDTLTSYVDFMPTMLDLCGIVSPEDRSFHDGESLVPLMTGHTSQKWDQRMIFSDTQRVARPIRWRRSAVMKQTWRMIDGCDLYNIATDPGQTRNVADQHPEIIEELRAGYDVYWDLVSGQFDRDIPFAIGETDETVTLTTHDIRNERMDAAWHQAQVRRGIQCGGYWEVDIRSAGTYEIELCRWPKESGHALTEGIEGADVGFYREGIMEHTWRYYTDGEALPLRWARLEIAGQVAHKSIETGDKAVRFELDLPIQQTRLFAAFHGDKEATFAPYYIYIRKIG